MLHTSKDLAKHIIYLLEQKILAGLAEYTPTNTKIQKLLYIYVGYLLKSGVDKNKIIDELPNAWDYGPVFPVVFKMIDKCDDITDLSKKIDTLDNESNKIMESVIDTFGKINAGQLSSWTHLKDSPWDIVYNEQNNKYGKIPFELIGMYFQKLPKIL